MLTPNDFQNLLTLISSNHLTVTGDQVQAVAVLQHKLRMALQEAARPAGNGDDSKSAE